MLFVGCANEEPAPVPPTAEITITMGATSDIEAEYTVTANPTEALFFVDLVKSADIEGLAEADIIANAIATADFMEKTYTGTHSASHNDLTPETAYQVIAFAYDTTTKLAGVLKTASFTTSVARPVMGFTVEVSGISAKQAEVKITPDGDGKYHAAVLPKAEITENTVSEMISKNSFETMLLSGETTLSFINATLNPATEYCVLLFPYDVENKCAGDANIDNVFNTAEEASTFTCEQAYVDSEYAEYTVTPSNPDMYWYCTYLDKNKYETEKENAGGSIFGYDIAWWEFIGSMYGETWQQQIKYDVNKGTYTEGCNMDFMRWNTPHVFYYYGIDYDGNVLTDIYVEEFTTLAPTPSDNVITATIEKVYPTGVDLSFTTTNDDQYFFVFQPKSAVDAVDLSTPEAKDQYIYDLMLLYYNYFRFFQVGDFSISFANDTYYHFSDAMIDTDMCLIVFGYDGGPTTEMQIIDFHTPASY